jgi:hypothetical protein
MAEPALISRCEYCSYECEVSPDREGDTVMCAKCGTWTKYPVSEATRAKWRGEADEHSVNIPQIKIEDTASQDDADTQYEGPHKIEKDVSFLWLLGSFAALYGGILSLGRFLKEQGFWLFPALVGGGLGFVCWLLRLAFNKTLCSECGNRVEPESKICPTCKTEFRQDS